MGCSFVPTIWFPDTIPISTVLPSLGPGAYIRRLFESWQLTFWHWNENCVPPLSLSASALGWRLTIGLTILIGFSREKFQTYTSWSLDGKVGVDMGIYLQLERHVESKRANTHYIDTMTCRAIFGRHCQEQLSTTSTNHWYPGSCQASCTMYIFSLSASLENLSGSVFLFLSYHLTSSEDNGGGWWTPRDWRYVDYNSSTGPGRM